MARIVTQKVSKQNLHGDRLIFSAGFGIPDSTQKLALSSNKSLKISNASTESKLRTVDTVSSNLIVQATVGVLIAADLPSNRLTTTLHSWTKDGKN